MTTKRKPTENQSFVSTIDTIGRELWRCSGRNPVSNLRPDVAQQFLNFERPQYELGGLTDTVSCGNAHVLCQLLCCYTTDMIDESWFVRLCALLRGS